MEAAKRFIEQFVRDPISAGTIECMIGWFSIALGISIWNPNLSVPYNVLNAAGSAQVWAICMCGIGLGLIGAHKIGNKAVKITMASSTFFAWGAIVALIKISGPLGPTGYNGLVICAYMGLLIWKYIRAD